MKFVEVYKQNKYEYYHASSNGNFIAKCVVTGFFSLSFASTTPKAYAVPAAKSLMEWVVNDDTKDVRVDTEVSRPLIDATKLPYIVRIETINLLQQNWDGCGAVKPNSDAIRNARHLVDILDKEKLKSLHPEDIYASTYGSVIFDFETQRGLVSVEIGDTSMGFFTDLKDGNNYAAEGIRTDFVSIPESLESFLS